MRNAHCRTRNMARKLKNKENETHTLGYGYGEKPEKCGK